MNKRFSAKYSYYGGHPEIPKLDALIANLADQDNKKPINFIIDSGCTYTWIGSEFRKLLKLQPQGPPFKSEDIEGIELINDATFITIEIPQLDYKKNSVKALIANHEGRNFLGRNVLNTINVFLLGKDLRYILHA